MLQVDVGKPLGPGGCRMQSRGAGWCHFGAVQGWLAASQEAEIYFFFSQLVSYGGGEVGWEEAEQIAILGMRKARELGRGRRRERGSPTDRNFCSKAPKPIKPQQTDTQSLTRHIHSLWTLRSRREKRPGYTVTGTSRATLREDVQTASAPQAPPCLLLLECCPFHSCRCDF